MDSHQGQKSLVKQIQSCRAGLGESFVRTPEGAGSWTLGGVCAKFLGYHPGSLRGARKPRSGKSAFCTLIYLRFC